MKERNYYTKITAGISSDVIYDAGLARGRTTRSSSISSKQQHCYSFSYHTRRRNTSWLVHQQLSPVSHCTRQLSVVSYTGRSQGWSGGTDLPTFWKYGSCTARPN